MFTYLLITPPPPPHKLLWPSTRDRHHRHPTQLDFNRIDFTLFKPTLSYASHPQAPNLTFFAAAQKGMRGFYIHYYHQPSPLGEREFINDSDCHIFRLLQCWEAWDTISGHKDNCITPSIAWRREAWKEEVLDDLPWKDERGPSSVRRTLGPFQR